MATRWLRKGESQNAGVGVDRNCESIFSGDRDVTAATRGRPANQRGPWAQPGERPDGPIRGLAARCVTGRTPHAVANQRAPRLVRANVTERTKGAQGACARVSVTASARARGRRERKREERRGEGRRGEAAAAVAATAATPTQVSRSAAHGSAKQRQRPLPPARRWGSGSARARQ